MTAPVPATINPVAVPAKCGRAAVPTAVTPEAVPKAVPEAVPPEAADHERGDDDQVCGVPEGTLGAATATTVWDGG